MPPRKPKTQVQRNAALKRANKRRGLRQATVWVPQYRVYELHQLAEQWRTEHAEINAEWVGDNNRAIHNEVYSDEK